jgi:transposase
MQITTIGLDIAKNVFQVHGIDAAKEVIVRKQLRRGQLMNFFEALPPCLIGMGACATAHSIDCNRAASCSGVPTMQYNYVPQPATRIQRQRQFRHPARRCRPEHRLALFFRNPTAEDDGAHVLFRNCAFLENLICGRARSGGSSSAPSCLCGRRRMQKLRKAWPRGLY